METRLARIPPIAQKLITTPLLRPRLRAGVNSAIAEVTAEYSPPTPSAVMKRNSTKIT